MNKLILFACVLTMGLFFNSCKDEGDVTDPVVTISEPAANSSYAIGDTIRLRGTVTDDEELKTINISSDLGIDIPITTFDSPTSHAIGYNIIVVSGTPADAYTLTITGIDASANEGSGSVSVTVQ